MQQAQRDVLDKYSPIVGGQTGLAGWALRLIARPVEWAINMIGQVGQYPLEQGYENTAQQTISDCTLVVPMTLARMERGLQNQFAAATARPGASMEAVGFLITAVETKNDAAVLAPLFNVRSGVNAIGGETYQFMAAKDVTLEAAITQVENAMMPQPVYAKPAIRRQQLPLPLPQLRPQATQA